MPIYEYKCQTCGSVTEVLVHGFNNDRKLSCSNCGSGDLQKLLSVPSLLKEKTGTGGTTCCGRTERCDKPPCSSGNTCHRA